MIPRHGRQQVGASHADILARVTGYDRAGAGGVPQVSVLRPARGPCGTRGAGEGHRSAGGRSR
ncbi:unnamed protein product, partial [Ascophyllum nodosum]